jgi:F-type H+-transporting ATPase subunit b
MLIDWFTVIAQLLNFFILVWLMKRFLYKPILCAIDEREQRIVTELESADTKKSEAQKSVDEYNHKHREFEHQCSAISRITIDETAIECKRLLDEARNAAGALSSRQQEALRIENQSLEKNVSHRIKQEVFAITRKALSDLAGTILEDQMVDVFTRRLSELDAAEKNQLVSTLNTSHNTVIVCTAFYLSPEQNVSVVSAIKENLGAEVQVRFETSPELVSGIELTLNGQKIAWSITDYMTSFDKGVDQFLEDTDTPRSMSTSKNRDLVFEARNQ